jgi:hypothetical protein
MDGADLLMEEEEKAGVSEGNPVDEGKPAGKGKFSDTLLAQLMCATPVALPKGAGRRVYGVMSDTPMSRRTRLYQ